jgi:hypothetical protein
VVIKSYVVSSETTLHPVRPETIDVSQESFIFFFKVEVQPKQETFMKQAAASCWFLSWLEFQLLKIDLKCHPKRRFSFNRLQGHINEKK